jgi:predicted secreted protein
MAKAHGKLSSMSFPNLTVGDATFTVTDTADTAEVTDFADGAAGFKKWLAGLRDWEVTVGGPWDDTPNTAAVGDEGALVLQLGAGNLKFSGNAILISQTVTVDVNDAIRQEWTFKGNGALTEPTA